LNDATGQSLIHSGSPMAITTMDIRRSLSTRKSLNRWRIHSSKPVNMTESASSKNTEACQSQRKTWDSLLASESLWSPSIYPQSRESPPEGRDGMRLLMTTVKAQILTSTETLRPKRCPITSSLKWRRRDRVNRRGSSSSWSSIWGPMRDRSLGISAIVSHHSDQEKPRVSKTRMIEVILCSRLGRCLILVIQCKD
jgi:hypothetical protein